MLLTAESGHNRTFSGGEVMAGHGRLRRALWAELSYHSGIVGDSDELAPAYRDLFARYSERFLIGSDTWIDQRWTQYDDLMRGYRAWLAQLPLEQARNIAHANAERLFNGKV